MIVFFKKIVYIAVDNTPNITLNTLLIMIVWIVIGSILVFAFAAKALNKLRRRKYIKNHHPNINTRKKRLKLANRFRHLEGLGD